jgi:paraquat-inducible protein B
LRDGAARFPEIAERAESLIAGLGELPLEDLVAQLTELATSANALVSSETTQALPADLSASLAEVQGLLAEVREADVVGNVNATLQSARAAADTLPGLVERAGGLLDQAGTTLNGLASTGGIVAEAQSAIREVARAAEAVAELARTIERDPNSLIFGRD